MACGVTSTVMKICQHWWWAEVEAVVPQRCVHDVLMNATRNRVLPKKLHVNNKKDLLFNDVIDLLASHQLDFQATTAESTGAYVVIITDSGEAVNNKKKIRLPAPIQYFGVADNQTTFFFGLSYHNLKQLLVTNKVEWVQSIYGQLLLKI